MKLKDLINRLQEEAEHAAKEAGCPVGEVEVQLLVGGRKPDEASWVDLWDCLEGIHAWGGVVGLMPMHHDDGYYQLASPEDVRMAELGREFLGVVRAANQVGG
jgi:hypothetical protein